MPIKPENRSKYPRNWKEISQRIRTERAQNQCEQTLSTGERCPCLNGQPNPRTGATVVLTVAHLDHDPSNNDDANLLAMCQQCHNRYDAEHRKTTRQKSVPPLEPMDWAELEDGIRNHHYMKRRDGRHETNIVTFHRAWCRCMVTAYPFTREALNLIGEWYLQWTRFGPNGVTGQLWQYAFVTWGRMVCSLVETID